jgi:hypothetical protein
MPCVAVSHASRPEAAYTASRLSGLAQLPSSFAPTLLFVGYAFEAVLNRDAEPERTCLDQLATLASTIRPDFIE